MLDLLISSSYAQEAAAGAQQPNPMMSFLPFVFIFFIFYFLMIKPQKKKLQEEQVMLKALTKGDEVYTKSGILGTIYGLTEKLVTLEVAQGVKMKVLRANIAGKSDVLFETKETKK
ncbi:MAG: preprotein translocase subunit YajC [Bdellovibrionales bacterium]|jgi:preprotein translocase subunit YajC|nr:preprotein translocase subunit YajC [Bdellovibrionales bacterium]